MAAPLKFVWTTQHVAFVKAPFWQRMVFLLRGWIPVTFEIDMAVPYRNACRILGSRHRAERVGLFAPRESVIPERPIEGAGGGKAQQPPEPKKAS